MSALLVGETPLSLVGVVDVIHAFGRHSAVAAGPSAAMARARVLDEPSWDLIFLDPCLPDAEAFHLMAELRSLQPDVPVVLVSPSVRKADVLHALDQGAVGFIPADSGREALAEAVRLIAGGGVYVPPSILRASGERSEAEPASIDAGWDGHWNDAPRPAFGPERSPASRRIPAAESKTFFQAS